MTPLLWEIMKNYASPRKDRVVPEDVLTELRGPLTGVHSYEITAIWESCANIVYDGHSPNGTFTFSPGESVWLEALIHDQRTEGRVAFLIVGYSVWRFTFTEIDGRYDVAKLESLFEPQMSGMTAYAERQAAILDPETKDYTDVAHFRFIRAAFSIINRPRHVNLKVHQPHRGRLKKLNGTGFPLHVWHEVVVGGQTRDHGGQEVESMVSGTRPYHHVRAHFKPSLGIVVPEHWRGDPSIGTKRTRYRVEKPR